MAAGMVTTSRNTSILAYISVLIVTVVDITEVAAKGTGTGG